MMPVQDMAAQHTTQPPSSCTNPGVSNLGENINYKKKYKALKRKMQMLVYEQECFMEELKKAQRRLLKVSRDRSFLLDRLLKYEKLDDTSDDSDVTASSDSEAEVHKEPVLKRKKTVNQNPLSLSGGGISILPGNLNKQQTSWLMQMSGAAEKAGRSELTSRRKTTKVPKKSNKTVAAVSSSSNTSSTGQMTREELERHLELKQSAKPQYMSVEKTPCSLPDDIFSNDNSNQDGELLDVKNEGDLSHCQFSESLP